MSHNQLKIFFDSDCPFCRLEARWLGRWDKKGAIVFEDIAAPDFDASAFGFELDTLHKELHATYPDGTVLVGMDVFRAAYRAVGLGWLLAPTGWPVLRGLFDWLYRMFAKNRVVLGRRIGGRCVDGTCRSDG